MKYDGKPKYHKMKWIFKHPVLLGGLVLVLILAGIIVFSETFGVNPTRREILSGGDRDIQGSSPRQNRASGMLYPQRNNSSMHSGRHDPVKSCL